MADPKLIADAPSPAAARIRESEARELAAALGVPFESACALRERAPELIAKLPLEDRRWAHTLRAHAEAAHIARGSSAAATGLYHRRARDLDDAAAELAAATGAKPTTPLYAAVCHLIAHPPAQE